MMKLSLITALIIFPLVVMSQDMGLIQGINARLFKLKNSKDTIDFILIDGKIDTIKPVLIFCQGSYPIPLIVKDESNTKYFTLLPNFDYKKITKEFHLVFISMPHTPVEAYEKQLTKNYCYVTDTSKQTSYSPGYLANNYAENYIRRAKNVIDFLSVQKWVNAKKIILFGHSQGSKTVIGASLNNPKVYKVGYAGGNPLGRIDQLIRKQRELAKEGKITAEESQQQIESIYEMWKEINKDPNAVSTEFGDPNRSWTSFSKPLLDNLLKIKQPLYVTYGTEDITATFCDLLPIYFIREHKTNLTMKPYVGLEHNFFEIDKEGRPMYDKGHWQNVMDDFAKWAK